MLTLLRRLCLALTTLGAISAPAFAASTSNQALYNSLAHAAPELNPQALKSALSAMQCAVNGGAQAGLILAMMITYRMYRPASMMPGKNAPAYSCTTDTPAVAP